ncbi:MAG: DUF6471 domain-containing protein [Arcobacteraceae bacterium]
MIKNAKKLPEVIDWKLKAKSLIKVEMAKQNINYVVLSEDLKEIEINIDSKKLSEKINRGTFSFVFAMQVFKALNIKNLQLED